MPEINKLLCRATIVLTFLHFFSFILDEKKLEISHSARECGSGQGKKCF